MSSGTEFSQLLSEAQAGDQPSLERLMLLYRSVVVSETGKFVGSLKSDLSVQDLEQETWIRVWTRLPGFAGSDDNDACERMFASWLRITTRRVALGIVEAGQAKKRGGEQQPMSLEEPIRDSAKSPSSIVSAEEEQTQLFKAIRAMDGTETAEIVRLHYLEGISVAEVAERMGLSSDQVRYRISQALKNLGQQFDE